MQWNKSSSNVLMKKMFNHHGEPSRRRADPEETKPERRREEVYVTTDQRDRLTVQESNPKNCSDDLVRSGNLWTGQTAPGLGPGLHMSWHYDDSRRNEGKSGDLIKAIKDVFGVLKTLDSSQQNPTPCTVCDPQGEHVIISKEGPTCRDDRRRFGVAAAAHMHGSESDVMVEEPQNEYHHPVGKIDVADSVDSEERHNVVNPERERVHKCRRNSQFISRPKFNSHKEGASVGKDEPAGYFRQRPGKEPVLSRGVSGSKRRRLSTTQTSAALRGSRFPYCGTNEAFKFEESDLDQPADAKLSDYGRWNLRQRGGKQAVPDSPVEDTASSGTSQEVKSEGEASSNCEIVDCESDLDPAARGIEREKPKIIIHCDSDEEAPRIFKQGTSKDLPIGKNSSSRNNRDKLKDVQLEYFVRGFEGDELKNHRRDSDGELSSCGLKAGKLKDFQCDSDRGLERARGKKLKDLHHGSGAKCSPHGLPDYFQREFKQDKRKDAIYRGPVGNFSHRMFEQQFNSDDVYYGAGKKHFRRGSRKESPNNSRFRSHGKTRAPGFRRDHPKDVRHVPENNNFRHVSKQEKLNYDLNEKSCLYGFEQDPRHALAQDIPRSLGYASLEKFLDLRREFKEEKPRNLLSEPDRRSNSGCVSEEYDPLGLRGYDSDEKSDDRCGHKPADEPQDNLRDDLHKQEKHTVYGSEQDKPKDARTGSNEKYLPGGSKQENKPEDEHLVSGSHKKLSTAPRESEQEEFKDVHYDSDEENPKSLQETLLHPEPKLRPHSDERGYGKLNVETYFASGIDKEESRGDGASHFLQTEARKVDSTNSSDNEVGNVYYKEEGEKIQKKDNGTAKEEANSKKRRKKSKPSTTPRYRMKLRSGPAAARNENVKGKRQNKGNADDPSYHERNDPAGVPQLRINKRPENKLNFPDVDNIFKGPKWKTFNPRVRVKTILDQFNYLLSIFRSRVRRPDIEAGKYLMSRRFCFNEGWSEIGSIPGVEVGDRFTYRTELLILIVHRTSQGGIEYIPASRSGLYDKNGRPVPVAVSVVSSGGYKDDQDDGETLIYVGSGGGEKNKLVPNTRRWSTDAAGDDKRRTEKDQELVRGNLALRNSCELGIPVRVVRGQKNAGGLPGDGMKTLTYWYDGLYKVTKYYEEIGSAGSKVWKFQLVRRHGQRETLDV
ncbi:hypothetical protein R1flu_012554 [Riccia fluitans]|uniref:YDG domain-containing protein n=1 Tax=Riccia fluitans TaxID=41844 RepID=A0ABD1ZAZ1_9MARC